MRFIYLESYKIKYKSQSEYFNLRVVMNNKIGKKDWFIVWVRSTLVVNY